MCCTTQKGGETTRSTTELQEYVDHLDASQVVKGGNNEKLIIPKLVLEIPTEFASLYYDHQSLEYIEAWQTDEPAKPM